MRVTRACTALEKGCCLELHYDGWSRMAEVHAVGFDADDRSLILAWLTEAHNDRDPAGWQLLYLDETRKVAVSGYFSEAPRPGYIPDDRMVKILCALPYEGIRTSTASPNATVATLTRA